MKAAMRRIGPSRLVVTVASACERNPAGVVQYVQIGMCSDDLFGSMVDALRLCGVDPHGVDTGMISGDPLQPLGPPAADDDGVAPGLQPQGKG